MTPSDPHGFNAQWGYVADRDIGMCYCRSRYYAPGWGRWIERDPIGFDGGMNSYSYCAGQPVGNADPSGLDPQKGKPWFSDPNFRPRSQQDIDKKCATARYLLSQVNRAIAKDAAQIARDGDKGGKRYGLGVNDISSAGGHGKGIGYLENRKGNLRKSIHKWCNGGGSGPSLLPVPLFDPTEERNSRPFWRCDNPWAWAAGAGGAVAVGFGLVFAPEFTIPAVARGGMALAGG